MLLPLLFAVIFAALMLAIGLGLAFLQTRQKNQIRSMLRKAEATPAEQRNAHILRAVEEENILSSFLERFQFTDKIELFLEQASQDWTASKLITLMAGAAVAGLVIGLKLSLFNTYWSSIALALLLGSMPFLMVWRKRSKAISQFEEQLPEALDFLSRSMRAGHGFSVALEMLAADSPEPLGGAFRKVSNEIHLGSPLDVALGRLVQQVPIVDVRFFVSSVVLQQETGGNLGEILSKLAEIIRDRFRLRGSVKAAAAHGKVTGLVLIMMPVAVTIFLMLGNPQYLTNMMLVPIGRYMVYGACAGQVVGYLVIKKIVDIRV